MTNTILRFLASLLLMITVPVIAGETASEAGRSLASPAATTAPKTTAPTAAAPKAIAPTATAPTAISPTAVPPMTTASVMQMLLGLGLVVAVILLLAWVLRRVGGVGAFGHSGLRIVASLPLGTRERVVLVQAGEQQLLLGVAPGRVNLLQSFDKPLIDPQSASGTQFASRLKEAISRNNEKSPPPSDGGER